MIKCGKLEGALQCVLYSKDGSKVLGKFPYAKHGGEKGAKAAAHKREGQVQFFKKKSLEAAVEQFGAAPVLAYIAKSEAERGNPALRNELVAYVEKKKEEPFGGSFSKMWKEKFGGSVDKCVKMMEGKVDDAGAYCASLKDKALKRTTWRGKGKHEKKSFEEDVEEALEMLKKDEQTEEPKAEEGEPPLSDALTNVDLGELERFLEEWGRESAEDAEPAAEVPPEEAEPTGVETEPEPEEEVPEEWDNNFLNLIRVRHQVRRAAIKEAVFGPEDEEE